jgi:hypothetical protein
MYYSGMAQPTKPPISIRIPDETRSAVEQFALDRGIPRNAAYVELLNRALKLVTGSGPRAGHAPKRPMLAVPAVGPKAAVPSVQFGPSPFVPRPKPDKVKR